MIIKSFKLFANQIGWRLGILFLIALSAGIAEGFGVSMILPLLESDIEQSESTLGKLIRGLFNVVNLPTTGTNILIMLVLFFLVRGVLLMGQTWYQASLLANHLSLLRGRLIRSIFKTDYTHVAKYDSGYLTNGVVREIEHVNHGMRSLIDLVVALVTASVYILLPVLMQPLFTVSLFALAIPLTSLSIVMVRKTKALSIRYTKLHGRQESFFIEGIRNAKYVKATGLVTTISDRMIRETNQVSEVFRKFLIISGISRYGPEPLVVFVMAAMIIIFTRGFDHSITEILFLMFLFYQSAKNMIKVQSHLWQFMEATGSLRLYEKLRNDLEAHPAINNSEGIRPNLDAVIKLSKITVTYPDADASALTQIDLEIPNRSTVALVGASGSGKTTIANLVCGLIIPSSGEISIGGVPYKSINIQALQQSVGYVTQESAVFNGSLLENVTLWHPEPDIERVSDILNQLDLKNIGTSSEKTNFIHNIIGGDGAQLSGGERQRLSIARELYRNPKLMILDEATSALDSELELKIDELLESERGRKAFLIIAHRLSTVRNADLIYVIDNGKVTESGGFDELVNANGQFTQMVKMQSF
ncbi:MAG: ABC transporter ATP-binding protein [Chloroflexota bacterium]|nr:ABC transporter ATP-binding protein [Chloroflexota bacterium]